VAVTAEQRPFAPTELIGERVVILHGPGQEEGLSGRDLDCLVDRLDLRWPLRLGPDWTLCQWSRYDLRAWYWVLEHGGEFIDFDVTDDPHGFCRDAIRTSSLLSGLHGDPSRLLHAAYLTLKRARKEMVDPASWAQIGRIASRDPSGFLAELERLGGAGLASVLGPPAIAGTPPTPQALRTADGLRWLRRFGSPRRALTALSLGATRYAKRISHPAGLSVLLVGPDGAGKSTLAARLSEVCSPMFRRQARSHFRPGILPRPGALINRAPADPAMPHVREAFGVVPSWLLLAYYWADFLLGGLLHDAPVKIRAGLLVRERGWWDIAVDPRRYRLRPGKRSVSALGRFLPHPDLVIVLEGDPELLHRRKPELERQELARQLTAWRSCLPTRVPTIRIDVSRPIDEVVGQAAGAVVQVAERRATTRLDAGWVTLPVRRVRWWLPRGPRAVAIAGLSIYQPVTRMARLGWTAARTAGGVGGMRMLPRGSAPPRAVRRALAPHVPPCGTFAVARASHPGRFLALLLEADGRCRAVAKLATDPAGIEALDAEARSLRRVGERDSLPDPLIAPRVLHDDRGLLLLEPFDWTLRTDPCVLEPEVARALGEFFRGGAREDAGGPVGPAHGDFAPWNLLRTSNGWALIDWEAAEEAPAFFDVCHFVVQSHALIGQPSGREVIAGFTGRRGWVGRAVTEYAVGADVDPGSARAALVRYLRSVMETTTARTGAERRGLVRRRRLLARLEPGPRRFRSC
jgi:Phosphotransferase enzyme family